MNTAATLINLEQLLIDLNHLAINFKKYNEDSELVNSFESEEVIKMIENLKAMYI